MSALPMSGMDAPSKWPAVFLFSLFLLSFGCLARVDPSDKLSAVPGSVVYNFSRYVDASLYSELAGPTPCSCMVCSKEKPSWTTYVLNTLLPGRWLEFSLTNATCQFVSCNASIAADLFEGYAVSGAKNCNITNPLSGQVEAKVCEPRFFMLGQGASAGEYAAAQAYCNGQLKMPVLWAVPNATTGRLDRNLSSFTLACYLERDQMPLVVWYSQGRYINTADYSALAASFNKPSSSPALIGPVMLTTEALLNPYQSDASAPGPSSGSPASGPAPAPLLNFSALDATGAQLRAIKSKCPSCLSVLALRPVFNSDNQPDTCALDYLLNANLTRPRPEACRAEYGGRADLFNSRQDFWRYTDLVGSGFVVNDNPGLSLCSPDAELGRQLAYSRASLRQFYKPSVWYAVGIAPGPTATPGCTLSDLDVSNAYESLITFIPGLASSGVVGLAPYRFSDDPALSPLPFGVEQPLFSTTSSTLDGLRAFKAGSTLVLNSSSDPSQAVEVSRCLPAQSDSSRVLFLGTDGNTYAARAEASGALNLSLLASRFGFVSANGTMHSSSAYTWFSDCTYYSTNRGPLFGSAQAMDAVVPGATLSSPDGQFSLAVGTIDTASSNETLFWGADARAYAARPDGPGIKIYDRPTAAQAPLQPLMFSTNGRGSSCTMFESTKMYARAGVYSNANSPAYPLTPSRNAEDLARIALLSCGGGACLSSAPMPLAFCNARKRSSVYSDFPQKACTQYPEMDAGFGEAPPLLMRAIARGESSRFGNDKYPDNGSASAACEISYKSGGCDGPQTAANLTQYPSAYCTAVDIGAKVSQVGENNLCAYGVMACIRSPAADYNPFDPSNSAQCGAYEFMSKNTYRYMGQLQWITSQWASSPILQKEIAAGELEWYAAWMAAYAYSGMGADKCPMHEYVQSYQPRQAGDTLVDFVLDRMEACCASIKAGNPNAQCYPYYGTNVILRYNAAIKTCGASCPYRDCSAVPAGGDWQQPFTP